MALVDGQYAFDLGSTKVQYEFASAPEVVEWVERAWAHIYGFNHEEACACAQRALDAQPDCAFAHATMAHALGTNYNNPYGLSLADAASHAETAARLAGVAAADSEPTTATTTATACTEMERAFIGAVAARYLPRPGPKDDGTARKQLDRAFTARMRAVAAQYPECPDVAYVLAESLMNLRPWQLWNRSDPANIRPASDDTLIAVQAIEDGLSRHPNHPGLCHIYIHAQELGPTPRKALPQAEVLYEGRAPEHGHLLHMPSHIYTWVGAWQKSTETNITAVAADNKYVRVTGQRVSRYLGYRIHNMHFVAWSAMFEGRRAESLKYAAMLEAEVDAPAIEFCLADGTPVGRMGNEAYVPILWHVLIRFGMWDEILAKPLPEDKELFATTYATGLYARGIAYAAKGMVDEAEATLPLFLAALESPALEGRVMHNNPVYDPSGNGVGVLNVGIPMLRGELEYRKGNYAAAFAHLREAVRLDLGLDYDEPWGWMVPARHALGALLLEQRHFAEAAAVFKADLDMYPRNLWASQGLLSALDGLAQGGKGEGEGEGDGEGEGASTPQPSCAAVVAELGVDPAAVAADLKAAQTRADISVTVACFCATTHCC